MTTWTDPAWLEGAHAWIRRHAPGEVTAIEQPHVRPWATAMRVETTGGVVWFKASTEAHRHEAALTALLARVAPQALPELLAWEPESGWMLTRDAGERLRELVERERSLRRWFDVLPIYARLQRDAAPLADELLAAGAPDRRLTVLPELFDRVLDRIDGGEEHRHLVPLVADRCARLAAYGIPDTIQHDDLHDAQVFVRDGRYLITDWGDAVVTHPFLTMSVTLEGVIQWGVDDVEGSEDLAPYAAAYLKAWGEGLEDALALALPLGWACRCVGSELPEEQDALAGRLGMLERGLARD